MRYCTRMTLLICHVFFVKIVLRVAGTLAGAASFATSPSVVRAGAHATDLFPVSLNVINFQSVPPHCGPGAATWALAGITAAVRAATTAAAARTKRISAPPRGGSVRRAAEPNHRPGAGRQ